MFSVRHNANFVSHGNPFVTRTEFKRTLLLCGTLHVIYVCIIYIYIYTFNTWPNLFGHTSTSSHIIIIVIIPLLQR